MPTLKGHLHDFADWPFPCSTDTAAFTTTKVLDDGLPVLLASHDEDGGWQFLCGTTLELDDLKLVCLGCALERDSTIAEVADLPIGWVAERRAVGEPWVRQPNPDDVV